MTEYEKYKCLKRAQFSTGEPAYTKFSKSEKINQAKFYKASNKFSTASNKFSKAVPYNSNLDDIIKSIISFGGIGLLFSLFSKPVQISAENVQLAPPFPNYMIYIFLAMLIGGSIYFLIKKLKRK